MFLNTCASGEAEVDGAGFDKLLAAAILDPPFPCQFWCQKPCQTQNHYVQVLIHISCPLTLIHPRLVCWPCCHRLEAFSAKIPTSPMKDSACPLIQQSVIQKPEFTHTLRAEA